MKGLTTHQVAQLLNQHGLNIIKEQKKKTFIVKFFEQFNNFLTILLIIAAILSFIIGEPVDGSLIFLIVILNAFFGIYQEAKAEESIAVLKKMTVSRIRVIRDGKEQEIDSHYLVPGDIVFVEEGVKIPADGLVIENRNLEVNESALTGESLPVPKNLNEEVFMGTIITKGRGYIEIKKIGMETKFGKIASELSSIKDIKTPLQKKLEGLTKLIGIIGIFAAVFVFVLSVIQGGAYFSSFLLAISLAVAVVPEGLPAVMTITLAIGVKEMAKKKAIVRKLSAIEGLGGITLIATDKTGTLTTNKMKVKEIYVNNIQSSISNLQSPIPNVQFPISNVQNQKSNFQNDSLGLLLLNGVVNSTASLVQIHDHGSWDVLGDPTEGALLYLAQSSGQNIEMMRKEWEIIDEQSFDAVTKRMSVLVRNQLKSVETSLNQQEQKYLFSKGAPESILEISDKILINGKENILDFKQKEKIEKQVEEWGRKGLRVLAFSYKQLKLVESSLNQLKTKTDSNQFQPIGTDLTFLGMVAIHDAPRPEAAEAVAKAKTAGIKVVMITGDNEKTAEAIGVTLGIITEGEEILTGYQVEKYTDEELLQKLPLVKIFARTSPFHKHRIVKLFQKMGEIVAVTGDGVNDAIALKQADIGVAMGLVGTDVARETADMIITDDNFSSIVNAVEEGRNIIKNLKNAITYLLSCNITEAMALILGLVLGFPHIFYPLQFLYINLVTDGLPALSLAFSPRATHIMKQVPEKELSLINPFAKKYILLIGLFSAFLVLISYYFYAIFYYEDVGRTAAFTVLTLIQSFIYVDLWLSHQSWHKQIKNLISLKFISIFLFPFILQFIIVSNEKIAKLFNIAVISPFIYLQFIFISFFIVVGIRVFKLFVKR